MVTIHDIARETGVSPNTVARILSGRKGRPYNESKVLQASQKMGYVRNRHAANLRSGKSGMLGLLVPDIRNPAFSEFFQTLQDAAIPLGYQILLFSSGGRTKQELRALELMEQSRVEGVILNASEGESDDACDEIIKRLVARKIPIIVDGRSSRGLGVDEVIILNAQGIERAVDHLVQIGRKRIAFISGEANVLASQQRFEGYRQALRRHGLAFDDAWVSYGQFNAESGSRQVERLLRLDRVPDAIMAGNDLLALGAIRAIQAARLRVPEDIAVVGVDDIPLASLITPKLTTLRLPRSLIAREVIGLLQERIEAKDGRNSKRLTFELELCVRESA
jgi:LacI family transcriptional regulator